MTKNKPKNLLSHPVDIVISFKNKIFPSIFWIAIWWDVVKHRNTPFLQV